MAEPIIPEPPVTEPSVALPELVLAPIVAVPVYQQQRPSRAVQRDTLWIGWSFWWQRHREIPAALGGCCLVIIILWFGMHVAG